MKLLWFILGGSVILITIPFQALGFAANVIYTTIGIGWKLYNTLDDVVGRGMES